MVSIMDVEIVSVWYTKHTPFDFTLDLREVDKREARAFLGIEPMEALKLSLVNSRDSWAVIDKKSREPQGFFGVCWGDGYGIPWFVSNAELIESHSITFAKRSKVIIGKMLQRYGKLENYVSSENKASIKWLKWLGFTIHPLEKRFHDPNIFFKKFTKEV